MSAATLTPRSKASLCLALVGLAACGPMAPPLALTDAGLVAAPDGGLESPLEVGTGTQSFEPLTEGQPLVIIAGPQGGWHLWASVRVKPALDPTRINLKVKVKLAGAELTSTDYRVTLVKNGPWLEWYAMTALVPTPETVRGKPTTVEVIATDSAGRTATDARTVIPFGP